MICIVFRPGNPSQGIPLPIAIVSCRTTFKNVERCVHSISLSPPKQLVSQVYIEIAYHTVWMLSFLQSFHLQNAMEYCKGIMTV